MSRFRSDALPNQRESLRRRILVVEVHAGGSGPGSGPTLADGNTGSDESTSGGVADDAHAARGRDDDEDLMGYMGYTWDVGERGPTGPMARLRWNKRVYAGSGQQDSTRSDARTGVCGLGHRRNTPSGHDFHLGGVHRPSGTCDRILQSAKVYFC